MGLARSEPEKPVCKYFPLHLQNAVFGLEHHCPLPKRNSNQPLLVTGSFGRGKRPQTASSTQMSSSSSSQRKARPWRRSWTFSSRSCGALASRGYLVAGKLTHRPSVSSRQIRRASTQHRPAAVSVVGSTTMHLNISFQEFLAMFVHEFFNADQFGLGKSAIGGE